MPSNRKKMTVRDGDKAGRQLAKRTGRSAQNRRDNRLVKRFGPLAISFNSLRENYHSPFPQVLVNRFTASGYFYTGVGTGTGDYNFTFPMNYCYHPWAGVTTGITWGGLIPSTYNPIGYSSLLNGSLYTRVLVYDTLLEIDVVPQSVSDSVFLTVTPSDQVGAPSSIIMAQPLPFTKCMTFASGRTNKFGEYPLKYRFQGHKFAGLPQTIYDANLTAYNHFWNGGPGTPYYLVVNIETGDNSTLTAPLEVRVRQTFWVKLFQLDVSAMMSAEAGPDRHRVRREARAAAASFTVDEKDEGLSASLRDCVVVDDGRSSGCGVV